MTKQLHLRQLVLLFAIILCSGKLLAQQFEWVKTFGSVGDFYGSYAYATTADDSGNVYTASLFAAQKTFNTVNGPTTLASTGSWDVLILKQNTDGDVLWAKGFGGSSTDEVHAIAVDDSGNVFVTGGFWSGTMDLDPGPDTNWVVSKGGYDIFIVKLDKNGDYVWGRTVGGPDSDWGNAIAVSSGGDVYITGSFRYLNSTSGDVDFDPGPGVSNLTTKGGADVFLLKLDAAGDFVWAKSWGNSSTATGESDNGVSVTLDMSGNVYVTGAFFNTVDFDPGSGTHSLTSKGGSDMFISKLTAQGDFIWANTTGGNGSDWGSCIKADKYHGIYVMGQFTDQMNVKLLSGNTTITSKGEADVIYYKLDTLGNIIWTKQLGGTGAESARDMDIDDAGYVFSAGLYNNTIDFDAGSGIPSITTIGGSDMFIVKMNSAGVYQWAKSIGGSSNWDDMHGIAVDNRGGIYVAGGFPGTVDFDPGPGTQNATAIGSWDIFVLKFFECIKAVAPATINGADSVCFYSPYTYTVSPVAGALSYTWTLPDGWVGSSVTNSIDVVTDNEGGVISVLANGVCDTSSSVEFEISASIPEVDIRVDSFELSTTNADYYKSWQWYLNDQPIDGADKATYIVTENGNYSVVVSAKGCYDTAYYSVSNVGIHDKGYNGKRTAINVFPNPATDYVQIKASINDMEMILIGIDGRVLMQTKNPRISLRTLTKGIYLLQIRDNSGKLLTTEKIVKN